MKLSLFILPLFAISIFMIGFLGNHSSQDCSSGKVSSTENLFTIQGEEISLESFEGKWVLLDFWASWNKESLSERKALSNAYESYQNKNIEMVSISLDSSKYRWENAIKSTSCEWLEVSDLKGWESAVCSKYGVATLPYHVLINPEGKIVSSSSSRKDILKAIQETL